MIITLIKVGHNYIYLEFDFGQKTESASSKTILVVLLKFKQSKNQLLNFCQGKKFFENLLK